MLDRVAAPEQQPGPRPYASRAAFLRRRTPAALTALAAAWAVTALAHLAHADLVLPALVVAATASLLRPGGGLLDRLVIAVGAVAGAALVGGLLFSVWPWGLHPVPVAGFAFTLLVAAAWGLRRKPTLPTRVYGTDLAVAGAGLAAWLTTAWPTATRPLVERLGYFAGNDTGDRLRQFSLFDAIRQIDGYAFLDPGHTKQILVSGMATNYPNGAHFLYALADSFRMNGAAPGNGVAEAHRYYSLLLLGYGAFVLATVWAARWVAGHRARGWRGALALSAIGAFLATGVMTTSVWYGFDSQVLGLFFTVLAIALLVRYPDRPVEQTVLVGLALIGVAFTYPLYAPALALGAAATMWAVRARLRRRLLPVAVTFAAVVPLVLVPIVVPRLAGDFNASSHLLLWGPIIRAPRRVLAAATAVFVLYLAVSRARRSPTQRLMGIQVAAAAVVALGLWVYQRSEIGESSYYLEKLLYAWLVTVLIGLGGAGMLISRSRLPLPRAARDKADRLGTRGRWAARGTVAVAAALAGVLLAGGISFGKPEFRDNRPAPDNTWGRVWADGLIVSPAQSELMSMQRRKLLGNGKFTMVVLRASRTAWQNALVTMQAAVLNHQLGTLEKYVADMPLVASEKQDARKALDPMYYVAQNWDENLEVYSRTSPVPLQIVSFDPVVGLRLVRAAAQNPCHCVKVVQIGGGKS